MLRQTLLANLACLLAYSSANATGDIGTLKLLDLNVWGLPEPYSKDRGARIRALHDVISANSDLDVVTLQEVWLHEDFDILRNATPYGTDFRGPIQLEKMYRVCSKLPDNPKDDSNGH